MYDTLRVTITKRFKHFFKIESQLTIRKTSVSFFMLVNKLESLYDIIITKIYALLQVSNITFSSCMMLSCFKVYSIFIYRLIFPSLTNLI